MFYDQKQLLTISAMNEVNMPICEYVYYVYVCIHVYVCFERTIYVWIGTRPIFAHPHHAVSPRTFLDIV